jgi:site-specific recombinase XerD
MWQTQVGTTGDQVLFIKPNGARVSVRYLQRLMEKLKAEAAIAGICTPHVLRHSFATEALEDDFTLTEVQALLRHAHLQTTAVYLHVRDKSLQSKMSRREVRR